MEANYGSLLSAMPEGSNFSTEVIAEVWAAMLKISPESAYKMRLKYATFA